MNNAPNYNGEPANLRLLRKLVTVLTLAFIAGFAIIVALFVYKFRDLQFTRPISLPDTIALPPDIEIQAFTQGTDWFAVVTKDERILIFERESGQLIQEIETVR